MTTQWSLVIGLPGTGKTSELTRRAEIVASALRDFSRIGYVSFTRTARREAAGRLAQAMNVELHELESEGWVRTLHSVCYRLLSKPRVLTARDIPWIEERLSAPVGRLRSSYIPEDEDCPDNNDDYTDTPASAVLSLWDRTRHTLSPFDKIWNENPLPPQHASVNYEQALDWIRRYTSAKTLEQRPDFTDLLLSVAGFQAIPEPPWFIPSPPPPLHNIPPHWFVDEAQDFSPLMWKAFSYIASHARTIDVAGDPFQAIYTWAGADPQLLLSRHWHDRLVLPRSWRCPANVWDIGYRLLELAKYSPPPVTPAPHHGTIRHANTIDIFHTINPHEDWLLLARTRYHLSHLQRILASIRLPWQYIDRPRQATTTILERAVIGCYLLSQNRPIEASHWRAILEVTPTRDWLIRGAKAKYIERGESLPDTIAPTEITSFGAAPTFLPSIHQWFERVPGAAPIYLTIRRWRNPDVLTQSRIRIGTVHAAKGAEADNVLILTHCTRRVFEAEQSHYEAYQAEQRTRYVAVTRTRSNLICFTSRGAGYPWNIL